MPAACTTADPDISQTAMLPLVSRQRISAVLSASKSPVAATCHIVGMLPTGSAPSTWVPFMNQIDVSPLVLFRQRMSLLPSASKSPMPATVHVVAGGTLPIPTADMMVAPFISHTARLPLVSCHRMSPRPSPLKSPVPTTDQLVGMLPMPRAEETCVPLMNQIAVLPLLSRHSRSAVPLPSKSRCPTIFHVAGGTLPIPAPEESVAPFISHMATLPLVSRHTMSLLPSLLASWVDVHAGLTVTAFPSEGMPLATT